MSKFHFIWKLLLTSMTMFILMQQFLTPDLTISSLDFADKASYWPFIVEILVILIFALGVTFHFKPNYSRNINYFRLNSLFIFSLAISTALGIWVGFELQNFYVTNNSLKFVINILNSIMPLAVMSLTCVALSAFKRT